MAIKIEDFDRKIARALQQGARKLTSKANLRPMAEKLAQKVRIRTRRGRGVPKKLKPEKDLPLLKTNTINARTLLDLDGELSRKTSPGRSNLTQRGDMLDSLEGKAFDKKIVVKPTGIDSEGIRNAQKAKWAKDKGFHFLSLSDKEGQKLKRQLEEQFQQLVRFFFKS